MPAKQGESPFDERCREAFRILSAMHEGALTPDEAVKEWRRVRGEESVAPIYAPPEAMVECLHLALLEERGELIVALYGLTTERLEALVEAAQMIDAEGVEILDGPA